MRMRLLALMAATLVLCGRPALPGDLADDSMPKGLPFHISIRSVNELLKGADACAAASMAGTDTPVAAGTVLNWAKTNLPFLADGAAMDPEIHIYTPVPFNQLSMFSHAIVVGNVDADEFLASLEARGASIKTGPSGDLQLISSGFPAYHLRKTDAGLLIGSPVKANIDKVVGEIGRGWRPRHWAGGALGIAIDQPGKWPFSEGMFAQGIGSFRKLLKGKESNPALEGIDGKVFLEVLDALEEAVPAARAEVAGMRRLGFDIRMNGERLGVAVRVLSSPETIAARMGAAAGGRGNVDSPLARKVREDAMQVMILAAPDDMLPGFGESLLAGAGRLAERAFPAQRSALLAGISKYFASVPGEFVAGSYYRGGAIGGCNWIATENAALMRDSYEELLTAMNGIFKAAMPGFVKGDPLLVSDGEAGGAKYRRVAWDGEFMARYWELSNTLFNPLPGRRAASLPMPEWLKSFASLVSAGDGFVVLASGALAESELAEALKPEAAERPLLDRPAAGAALADLPFRQIATILIDYDFMGMLMLENAASNPRMGGTPSEVQKQALRGVETRLRKTASLAGMAVGGDGGCLVADFSIPADTIGAMYHNLTLIHRASNPGTPSAQGQAPEKRPGGVDGNQHAAVTVLRLYGSAQTVFQIGRHGRLASNSNAGDRGYADNYRNLFYGNMVNIKGEVDPETNLQLLPKNMADAFAGPSAGSATNDKPTEAAKTASPYRGYLFLEPPGVDFATRYALVAYPAEFGRTGNDIFLVDEDGVFIMIQEQREGGLPRAGEMPALVSEKETRASDPSLWLRVEL